MMNRGAIAVGVSVCVLVVRTRIRGETSEMALVVACIAALVIACAVDTEIRHMIMWYDHMVVRSANASVRGKSPVEVFRNWGTNYLTGSNMVAERLLRLAGESSKP